jgi:hypothetical protein
MRPAASDQGKTTLGHAGAKLCGAWVRHATLSGRPDRPAAGRKRQDGPTRQDGRAAGACGRRAPGETGTRRPSHDGRIMTGGYCMRILDRTARSGGRTICRRAGLAAFEELYPIIACHSSQGTLDGRYPLEAAGRPHGSAQAASRLRSVISTGEGETGAASATAACGKARFGRRTDAPVRPRPAAARSARVWFRYLTNASRMIAALNPSNMNKMSSNVPLLSHLP